MNCYQNPGIKRESWDNRNGPGGACNTTRSLTLRIDCTDWRATAMVPKNCSIPACHKPIASRGMCDMHRAREARSGNLQKLPVPTPQERFWAKVEKTAGCWNWAGASNNRGYGVFRLDGRTQLAHRASWFFHHGTWPNPEKVLDHACDNKLCVNPAHLRELTNGQNIMRAHPRGNAATEHRRALNRIAKAKYRAKLKKRGVDSNRMV